jgi:Peptidase A4 family
MHGVTKQHGVAKQLARCLTACIPVAGLIMALAPAASASMASATPSAAADQAARVAVEHYLRDHRGILQRSPGHVNVPATRGASSESSTNWSGYADSGTGFTTVTGKWKQPKATCSGLTLTLAAFWVGIDGDGSDSVEQDGTMAACVLGTAYYFSWWEMYPTNSVQVVGSTVSPGDAVSASVARSGTSYALKVTDSTHTANSFSTTQTCSDCANSSAEWIAEAPSTLLGVSSLAEFGTWSLRSATVKAGSKSGVISSFTDNSITMVDSSGNTEAQPSALSSAGNAFKDAWKASS